MIEKRMEEALNKQINAELYSSYLYLAMSAYFEATNLSGFAHWMRCQADEERTHAMRIYGHIVDRDGRVVLSAVETPTLEWASPLAAFEDIVKQEKMVTGLIHGLAKLAGEINDRAAGNMLLWFIGEQIEEEKVPTAIRERLKTFGDSGSSLLFTDHELGKRE